MSVGVVFLGLLGWQALDSKPEDTRQSGYPEQSADAADERAAFDSYIANYQTIIATRIVPGLKRGILETATSRPRTLAVVVTDDPSPFNISTQVGPDDSLTVRLSLGYLTIHDAALDAVGWCRQFC